MIRRAIIIVLDSLGVGEMPDAAKYGDQGADTLGHILDHCPQLQIPNLQKMGMGNIKDAAGGRLKVAHPEGVYGRFMEHSTGKDTTTGHWEIAGLYTPKPFKTYPDGFPQELMEEFSRQTGRGWLGNCTASGTEIIKELGQEHEKTGKVIVYTSADSVFQVAANVDVVPLEELYSICEKARGLLHGKYACGRVIARPYVLQPDGQRVRTSDRRDYSVTPPEDTMLDLIRADGGTVYAVGKIHDIFNGKGITKSVHTVSNDDGVTKTIEAIKQGFSGADIHKSGWILILNTVIEEIRKDTKAIEEFDVRLPEIRKAMKPDDMLILCPATAMTRYSGWDHTQEHIFGLMTGDQLKKRLTWVPEHLCRYRRNRNRHHHGGKKEDSYRREHAGTDPAGG